VTVVRRLFSNRRAVVVGLVGLIVVVLLPVTASLTTSIPAVSGMNGNGTRVDRLGSPVGGCGVPQEVLGTPDFVALNVFHTPGDYGSYPRPLPPSLADKAGRWDNGRNCGRYVQVTIGDLCSGTNDGAAGKPFCRNGFWSKDEYNGATLTMVVADGCQAADAWCRDDRDHLGLSSASLNRFVKDGAPVGDLDPAHWNNRQISWSFVPAPDYRGDLRIGFVQGAHRFWPAIAVSQLPNGIHGVEYLSEDGSWRDGQPNGDLGQSFVIGSTTGVGTIYRIRVRDAADAPVHNGRVYTFTMPSKCALKCAAAHTKVDYSTAADAVTTTWSPPPTTTTTTPAETTTETTAPTTTTTTTTAAPSISCAATAVITNSWPGGFQLEVTVTNTGTGALKAWSTGLSLVGDQRIGNAWNALTRQVSRRLVADNQSYNGALAPGATTSWGAIVSGSDHALSQVSCTGG